MARRRINKETSIALKNLVTVAFAEDVDLAKQYRDLLKESDIPAVVKRQPEAASSYNSIAVMVPEDFLDEAHVIIQSQSSMGDFYDLGEDNEASYEDEDIFPELYDDDEDEFGLSLED